MCVSECAIRNVIWFWFELINKIRRDMYICINIAIGNSNNKATATRQNRFVSFFHNRNTCDDLGTPRFIQIFWVFF